MRNSVQKLLVIWGGVWWIFQVHAQPTLTNSTFPTIGQKVVGIGADTAGVQPGNSGANQIWNFSGLLPAASSVEDTGVYITPIGTPYFLNFPDANLAALSAEAQYYTYYKKEPSKLSFLGGEGGGLQLYYFNPVTVAEVPLTYNSSFSDTYEGANSTGSTVIYSIGNKTVKYDAYGTLMLPSGTFQNAMRLKTTAVLWDSLEIGGGYVTSTINQTNYEWFVGGRPGALLTIMYREGTSTVHIPPLPPIVNPVPLSKTVFYLKFSTTAVDEAAKKTGLLQIGQLRPNPSREVLEVIVAAAKNLSDVEISFIDEKGGVALRQETALSQGANVLAIPVHHLPRGAYWLQLRSKGETRSVPWIKE